MCAVNPRSDSANMMISVTSIIELIKTMPLYSAILAKINFHPLEVEVVSLPLFLNTHFILNNSALIG